MRPQKIRSVFLKRNPLPRSCPKLGTLAAMATVNLHPFPHNEGHLRNKRFIAGLIKGNQWLISPHIISPAISGETNVRRAQVD